MNLVIWLTSLLLGNSTVMNINIEQTVTEDKPEDIELLQKWEQYKIDFDKKYETLDEDAYRRQIFAENSKFIDNHNKLYANGHYTYELGHNQFSDITHEEYMTQYSIHKEEKYNQEPTVKYNKEPTIKSSEPTVKYANSRGYYTMGHNDVFDISDEEYLKKEENYNQEPTVRYNKEPTVKSSEPTVKYDEELDDWSTRDQEFEFMPPANVDLPVSVDWRYQGAVTAVKNEGHCQASWAFAATGSLEGQLYRRTRHLLSFSEQNLVDCSSKYGNHGCKNGTAANAFRYIMANRGIDTNTSYPWHGKQSWFCHYKKHGSNAQIHGIVHIKRGNESNLAAAVASVGPVAVAVDARSNAFRFYKHGIYKDMSCSPYVLTREMLVVGYGKGYWIVKNSWGRYWGAQGYIYISKSRRNECGIATRATYPIV